MKRSPMPPRKSSLPRTAMTRTARQNFVRKETKRLAERRHALKLRLAIAGHDESTLMLALAVNYSECVIAMAEDKSDEDFPAWHEKLKAGIVE